MTARNEDHISTWEWLKVAAGWAAIAVAVVWVCVRSTIAHIDSVAVVVLGMALCVASMLGMFMLLRAVPRDGRPAHRPVARIAACFLLGAAGGVLMLFG